MFCPLSNDAAAGKSKSSALLRWLAMGLLLIAALATLWWWTGAPMPKTWGRLVSTSDDTVRLPGKMDQRAAVEKFGSYADARASVEVKRRHLAARFAAARTHVERELVLRDTSVAFVDAVTRNIVPFWYGTEWDFNGITEVPGEGKIACGYFVATTLCHAGVRMNRVLTAQQASQCIIKTVTTADHMRSGHGLGVEEFVHRMNEWGPGLYVVGLDTHVGLLWVEPGGEQVWFVHSNGGTPQEVIKEPAERSGALSRSRYRIVGKISEDTAFLTGWLQGKWRETVLESAGH